MKRLGRIAVLLVLDGLLGGSSACRTPPLDERVGDRDVSLPSVDLSSVADLAREPEVAIWAMNGHDPQHRGRSTLAGPQGPGERWAVDASGSVAVISADGSLYVGSATGFDAIDPIDGHRSWSFAAVDCPGGPLGIELAIGPDGTVYLAHGCDQGATHRLIAVDPAQRIAKWTLPLVALRTFTVGSNGMVYAVVGNAISAIQPTGEPTWRSAGLVEGTSLTGIAIGDDGALIAVTASYPQSCHSIDAADGHTRWSVPALGTGPAPVIGIDGSIYLSQAGRLDDSQMQDARLVALDAADGRTRWSFRADNPWRPPMVGVGADGTIYLGGNAPTYVAIQPDGQLKWRATLPGGVTHPPVIDADGVSYILTGIGPQQLVAVDESGNVKWTSLASSSYFKVTYPTLGEHTFYAFDYDTLFAFGP